MISAWPFTITVDNTYELYFDGVQQLNTPNQADWVTTDTVSLPVGTSLIAIVGHNEQDSDGGIIASTSDDSVLTNSRWKCSYNYTSSWAAVDFDDSSWQGASEIAQNGDKPWGIIKEISLNARWIWVGGQIGASYYDYYGNVAVCCRLHLGKTINHNYIY